MSGSPVYIDGRLIGAVSYALGSFSKEPIAGITPIEEMTDATRFNDTRPPGARVKVDFPLTQDSLMAAFRKALNWNRPFADRAERRAADGRQRGRRASAAASSARCCGRLRRRSSCRGSSRSSPTSSASAFRDQGFVPTGGSAGGSRAGEMPFDGPLKPGDAVGVMFVGGDLQLGGTGTVTHIDGDRVYAFGHPMYNLGPTEFPMTRAYVYTVLPSLFSSMKLSTHRRGDRHVPAGSRDGDRRPARARAAHDSGHDHARIGPRPEADVQLRRRPRSAVHAADDLRELLNTLGSYERQFGAGDLQRPRLGDASRSTTRSRSTTSSPATRRRCSAAAYVVAPITSLMGNDYEKVDVEGST